MSDMRIEDIETEALRLEPRARARLAQRLLVSLDSLSDGEIEGLWAEEAERRDSSWDVASGPVRKADEVLRDARSRLE
jgi:hypothetical protein